MRKQKIILTQTHNVHRQNKYMCDLQIVSRKQIEFGIYIRNYRRAYNFSQKDFAELCTLYGKKTVLPASVSNWENFKTIPSEENMRIAMDVMHISIENLN